MLLITRFSLLSLFVFTARSLDCVDIFRVAPEDRPSFERAYLQANCRVLTPAAFVSAFGDATWTLGEGQYGVVKTYSGIEDSGLVVKELKNFSHSDLFREVNVSGCILKALSESDARKFAAVSDCVVVDGEVKLLMPLLSKDLEDALNTDFAAPFAERDSQTKTRVHRVLQDAALETFLLHRLGMVHKDIKLANFLFDAAGSAVLADFGLAELDGDPQKSRTGTLEYVDPALKNHGQGGRPNDVYALGVMFYFLLAGVDAYADYLAKASELDLSDGAEFAPPSASLEFPEGYRWVGRMLDFNQSARMTIEDVLVQLGLAPTQSQARTAITYDEPECWESVRKVAADKATLDSGLAPEFDWHRLDPGKWKLIGFQYTRAVDERGEPVFELEKTLEPREEALSEQDRKTFVRKAWATLPIADIFSAQIPPEITQALAALSKKKESRPQPERLQCGQVALGFKNGGEALLGSQVAPVFLI